MGKGDRKTRKGKIIKGTYGVRRPRKSNRPVVETTVKAKAKSAKPKAKAKPKTKAKVKKEAEATSPDES